MQIILVILIFLQLIYYIIFLDIILSWLKLLGINFRPQFIINIIDPLYKKIRGLITTTIGPLDFTPIIIIFSIVFIQSIILTMFPEAKIEYFNLIK